MAQFEFVILGAGAMGSIVGAHLTRAGHRVALLARGRRADALAAHGLTITGLAEFTTPVTVLTDTARLERAGTLIVATKTPGTADALQPLRHVVFSSVLSIQNGPLKNELLAQAFGAERTLGALADTSGEVLPDGRVLFTRNVNILIGELPGGSSARVERVVQALDAAGVRAAASEEILSLEWSKFCAWVGLVSLAVTTRAPTWKYLSDPDTARVLVRVVREMERLARGLGIPLEDRAILPTVTLCLGSEEDAMELVMRAGEHYRKNAPQHRMSALQDVDAARPLEVNETFGYAVDKARALNLELPLVEGFRALLAGIDRIARLPSG
ncbi:MAG: ketopantoate reductase family protein [Proteobacteria bacterium]|nr:ketopantoate reductase family protein [Pseudomonadota bacterium]